MWSAVKNIFKKNDETARVLGSVNESVIKAAYVKRLKEIESLGQYDRGEKNIDASDFGNIVSSIR